MRARTHELRRFTVELKGKANLFDEVVRGGKAGPAGARDGDLLPLGLGAWRDLCPHGAPSAAAEPARDGGRRRPASGDEGRASTHSVRRKVPESRSARRRVAGLSPRGARCSVFVCIPHTRAESNVHVFNLTFYETLRLSKISNLKTLETMDWCHYYFLILEKYSYNLSSIIIIFHFFSLCYFIY